MRVCQFRHFGTRERGHNTFRHGQSSDGDGDRTIATNRRARHEYEILETVEAGLVLRGPRSSRCGPARSTSRTPTPPSATARPGCSAATSTRTATAPTPTTTRSATASCCSTAGRSPASPGKIAERGLTSSPCVYTSRRAREGRARPGARQEAPRQAVGPPRARRQREMDRAAWATRGAGIAGRGACRAGRDDKCKGATGFDGDQ